MKKVVWTFGLISGGILSAMMLVTMPLQSRLGFDHGELLGYATMVAASLLIYFGVRSYRDNVGGGTVGFGRALVVSLLIGTIASACYVATWEVLFFGFMPDFGEKYATHQIDKLRASGASQAEIDRQVEEMKSFARSTETPSSTWPTRSWSRCRWRSSCRSSRRGRSAASGEGTGRQAAVA